MTSYLIDKNMKNTSQKFDLILRNAKVLLPNDKIEEIDIGITDSKIASLGNLNEKASIKTLDLKGLLVIPGAIDTQVHFREP